MKINELCEYLGIKNYIENKFISDVVTSTKDVTDNCVLILTKGFNVNPINYLTLTIRRKCLLILSDEQCDGCVYIPDLKDKVFDILDFVYFRHNHPFKIIGVTGTEGKSSLTDLLHQSLKFFHYKPLKISNESDSFDNFYAERTTPDSKTIINAMIRAKKEKKTHLIMEVSCIGITQKRVSLKLFDDIFLTNLNVDHLDYYHNIFEYHNSKIQLFQLNKKAKKYIFDFTYSQYPNLFNRCSNLKIIDSKNVKLKNSSLNHQVFIYKDIAYYSHLVFKQNRLNMLFLIEYFMDKSISQRKLLIQKMKKVKGRLDLVHSRPYIMIDDAHSSKSVENLLKEISMFKQNRILILIGAGGDRDKSKREEYGNLASKYGDLVIVSNDNPRTESPSLIANQIKGKHDDFIIELNRKKAIENIIKTANKDDIVLIIGRGNEEYQNINNRLVPCNDYYEVARWVKI